MYSPRHLKYFPAHHTDMYRSGCQPGPADALPSGFSAFPGHNGSFPCGHRPARWSGFRHGRRYKYGCSPVSVVQVHHTCILWSLQALFFRSAVRFCCNGRYCLQGFFPPMHRLPPSCAVLSGSGPRRRHMPYEARVCPPSLSLRLLCIHRLPESRSSHP